MFTGLVQGVARVVGVTPTQAGVRLEVDPGGWAHRPAHGESIALNGCCLTLADEAPLPLMRFDVIHETLAKTTLGGWEAGSRVNIEACVTPTTLLGGHVVQGHVDAVGEVIGIQKDDGWRVRVRPRLADGVEGPSPMEHVTPKGSITIDGVSLTVADLSVDEGWFEVALIPTTLEITTLGGLEVGSRVNLETDVLARTVIHWARNYSSGLGSSGPGKGC